MFLGCSANNKNRLSFDSQSVLKNLNVHNSRPILYADCSLTTTFETLLVPILCYKYCVMPGLVLYARQR